MGRQRPIERVRVDLGLAELVADPDRQGAWTLLVDGIAQSHVDLTDPTHLEFEYIRWLGHLVDVLAEPGRPLRVLHLGGGAWTLARYVAVTRPGSRQRVVDADARLTALVRERLPAAGIRVRSGDARDLLGVVATGSTDLVVLDAFAAGRTPAHLTSVEFAQQVARVVGPGGCYAVNIADGPPLTFARGQVATVCSVFTECCLVAETPVLHGRRFGNLVLVAGNDRLPVAELARRVAAEPFPTRVVDGADTAGWASGVAVVTDGTAVGSPEPPAELLGRHPL